MNEISAQRRATVSRPGSWMRAVVALALIALAMPAAAESLVSVQEQALPALPGTAGAPTLAVWGDRLVATDRASAWVLDDGGASWRAVAIADIADAPLSTAGSGTRTWRLGGADGVLERIRQLEWTQGGLHASDLPPPPARLRDAKAAILADTLYVAGLDEEGHAQLWAMPVVAGAAAQWRQHAGWPDGSAPTSLMSQKFALYLTTAAGDLWQWTQADGWIARGALPAGLARIDAKAIGQAHVAYVPEAGDGARPMLFHTITGSWTDWPAPMAADARHVVAWRNGLAWIDVGGRGHQSQLQSGKHLLSWLDWLVIVVYLAAMIGIGLYFYLREKRNSTENFFVGNRTIPFWAAGLSLYAVNTSSISFIAIPAKAFETNWQYLTNNLIAVLGLMFVAVWIVPLLRRLDLMSTFSYLETRFHPAIRMLASALAIVLQIGSRMSVILFLPALAIATITGISVVWSIFLMGGFTIVYTAMGGMKAVIWTDVVQVIVKMGGALFAILFIAWSLTGGFDGFAEFARIAAAEDKTKLFDFSFDLTKATVWGFIFLVLFEVVLTFPKDQVLMQRVLSTPDERAASRSIWAFAAIMIPGGFIFYGIGTALYVYYKTNPERLNPLLPIDATFPLFIAAELPMGVTGLIIAGIFAAAMATLSGIMNSVATLISVDFYDRFAKNRTQKQGVFFAEMMTVLVGLVGIGAALVLSRFDVHSLFDVSIELAGLLGGGFAGAYTLGMFTRRANSQGVAIGVAAAIVLTFVAWSFDLVHPYFYLAISIMVCVVVGYLASLLFPAPTRSLEGLTIHTRAPRGPDAAARPADGGDVVS